MSKTVLIIIIYIYNSILKDYFSPWKSFKRSSERSRTIFCVNFENYYFFQIILLKIDHSSLPCIDNITVADLRTQTFSVPPQEILTKDSVTISVDAVVYIRIFDPTASVIKVENALYSTRTLAATTLRNIFGTRTLQEVLQERESIANAMKNILDESTFCWGVTVERVEV